MLPPAPRPRPQALTGTRSSRCAAVLAACHGPGRVQRSRRKATCVPGRALPPIPPCRGGLRSPYHPAHSRIHPAQPGSTLGPPAWCGGPQKWSRPPPGPGVFPGQGAERTADGKPEPRQQLLYSAAWAAWGAVAGGVTSVGGGSQETLLSPCCREETESGVSACSPAPPPPMAPWPPTHHGHIVQVMEVGGLALAQPHQQHRCSPHQHADKEADDDDQAGVGFGRGLLCGGKTGTLLPPLWHCQASCPPSEHHSGSRGERGLKTGSSSPPPHCHPTPQTWHLAPVSPPPAGDQPRTLPPSLAGVLQHKGRGRKGELSNTP